MGLTRGTLIDASKTFLCGKETNILKGKSLGTIQLRVSSKQALRYSTNKYILAVLGAVCLIQPFGYPPGGIADKGTKKTKHQVLKLLSCLILGLNHRLLLRVPGRKMDEQLEREGE